MDIRLDKIERSRRKTICLQVTRDARVVIRVPYGFSRERIDAIIRRKRDWILRKIALVRTIETMSLRSRLSSGRGVPFLGRTYPVHTAHSDALLRFDGGFYLSASGMQKAEALLKDWYRARAVEIISERMRAFKPGLGGVSWRSVTIGNAKYRMGSCDSRKNIIFSWRICGAPSNVIDYVVAHEMAHLVNLNHSVRFWKLVASLHPGYKESRHWLLHNSHQLML